MGIRSVDATATPCGTALHTEGSQNKLVTPAASCSANALPTSAPLRRRTPMAAAARPMTGHASAASAGASPNSRLRLATARPSTSPTLLPRGIGRGSPAEAARQASRSPSQPVANRATPISIAATRSGQERAAATLMSVACSAAVVAEMAHRCSSAQATRSEGAARRAASAAQPNAIQAVIAPAHITGTVIHASVESAKAAANGTAVAARSSTALRTSAARRRRTASSATSATASIATPSVDPATSGTPVRRSSDSPATRRSAAPSITASANARA
jgi:hypothetical protein